MMVGLPNEIAIRCRQPYELASRLMSERIAERISIEGETITISTQHPATIYEKLPDWLRDWGLQVSEMRSADESLQALFNSLMKMHRGEL